MRDHLLPSEFIDLAHPRSLGPLFDQSKAHLSECPECRRTWSQGEALKALALESAPEVPRHLSKGAILAARRAGVDEAVRELPGGEDARDILLRRPARPRTLSWWIPALGALASGFLLFLTMRANRPPQPQPVPAESLPFEFDSKSPAEADEGAGAEAALDQEARDMLIAHLKGENRAQPTPGSRLAGGQDPLPPRDLPSPPVPPTAVPTAIPTPIPTPVPTAVPTAVPTPLPTALPTVPPTPPPTAVPARIPTALPTAQPTPRPLRTPAPPRSLPSVYSQGPEFDLENPRFHPLLGEQAAFKMAFPDEGSLEIRIFDLSGRSVRLVADGRFSAGPVELKFDGKNDMGRLLPAGSYYARVMTRWYSRVETLELLP